jgi:acyl-CoA synthetase (AMP-forming)/AMP-acid ligase II
MAQSNLFQLLKHASEGVPKGRIWVYRSQTPDRRSWSQDYSALLEDAKLNSYRLQNLVDLESVPIVLLYFDDYLDGLTWFWSVVAAGAVPCILGPLSGNTEHQRSFLRSIRNLLNDPLVITTNALASKFVGLDLSVRTIADIELVHITSYQDHPGESKHQTDLAVLMLTSGSTGGCKAVSLRHGQILEAVKGKSEFHQTQKNDVFLNWIGLDHVAGLIETHLHALSLTADQIHIPSAVFITDPIKFLGIIEERKVSYTFAPNFFLAQLVSVLKGKSHYNYENFGSARRH